MDLLKRQRGAVKASLTNFSKYVEDNFKDKTDFPGALIIELETRINGIEGILLEKFGDIQNKIEASCEDSDLEKEFKETSDFENKYYAILSVAKKYLYDNKREDFSEGSVRSQSDVSCKNPIQNVKLPDINLPIFDGAIQNWMEFRDTFDSLINKNDNLTDIQRFHYLRVSIKNEPAQLISTLEFSANNYKLAWDLLVKRFNNDKMLIQNHIKNIFNIEPINKEGSKCIRTLLNDLNKNMRALEQIGLPIKEWDVPIVYLIGTKLDKITSREWESQKAKAQKFPSLEDFKIFLTSKAELLDNLEQSRVDKIATRGLFAVDNNSNESFFNRVNERGANCAFCKESHYIQMCPKFLKIPIEKRGESIISLKLCLNCLRPGHFNRNCRRPPCKKCHGKHNILLHHQHNDKFKKSNLVKDNVQMEGNSSTSEKPPGLENLNITNSNSANCMISNVLLSTARIDVLNKFGRKQELRVILDSGSQSTFITEQASEKLGLVRENVNIILNGINCLFSNINFKCNTSIHSKYNNFTTDISCFVIPKITGMVPASAMNFNDFKIPNKYKLADPTFYEPQEIDMLIGSDLFWDVVCHDRISLGPNLPILQSTVFGWIVSGPVGKSNKYNTVTGLCCTNNNIEKQISADLQKFWELENVDYTVKTLSDEETECEKHFQINTTRNEQGAFVVKLPLKISVCRLGSTYEQAKKRYFNLEKKFNSNENYKMLYHEFIQEYIDLGHMSKVGDSLNFEKGYFMCHHGVYREDAITTNLRVVFDASLPSDTGYSLNNIQMVGPSIQEDLFSILIRFRQHLIVVAADCTKMYRSVIISPDDRYLQRILWRFSPDDPLQVYELNTVTYGTAAASFLAIRCLFQLAADIEKENPEIAMVIKNDFYVDDMLTGANTREDARRIVKSTFEVLKRGCFILRKFYSNCPSVLDDIPNIEPLSKIVELGENDEKKTLGLAWCPPQDTLSFNVKNIKSSSKIISKRSILSESSKLFDPLGLISPCIIVIKILLQSLWLEKLGWDDSVPSQIALIWVNFKSELPALNELKITRHALIENPLYIEMHIFSDSSEKAYGACIYLKSVNAMGNVCVRLVASKTKVAPLQSVSLPRLELCGALVGVRLANKVSKSLRIKLNKRIFWTDSTIVLGWVKTPPNKLKTFVANRVSEIQTISSCDTWKHVPSEMNPADYLSRGVKCSEIKDLDLWWNGPQFLLEDEYLWPNINYKNPDLPDIKKHLTNCAITFLGNENYVEKFSDLVKLKRTIALMHRFVYNCKNKSKSRTGPLLKSEIDYSFNILLRHIQHQSFHAEINQIKSKKGKLDGKLLKLSPFLDEFQCLRVGGRLNNAMFSFEKKHPFILPPKHALTTLILRHEHEKLYHCGPQHLLASVREKYWPVSGRSLARQIVRKCVKCFRYQPKILQPLMGNLPKERLIPNHPFDIVGVDYAGPILIKNRMGRGAKLSKSYVALFVCFLTKAVHLELVTDLTKEAFILALRRFSSRRGKPSTIFSDNGTNFVGACSELKLLGRFIKENSEQLSVALSKDEIDWRFIPPQSPHFGGLWEAGVKSMKHHLKRVISNSLTFEHLYTVLTEIEAIMNSRPISPLSANPNDLTPLTPSHFLIGRQLSPIPADDVTKLPQNRLSVYEHLQQLKQHIWRRWSKEYVSELQQRVKWKENYDSLSEGSIVLLKDDSAPPMVWKLGRVLSVVAGKDNIARVANIKTSSGILKRSFAKICPLPINI